MYFITDDGDNTVKIIAQLFRFFPCFTVGENRMQYSEIIPGQSLHHSKGDSGSPMDTMSSDLLDTIGDVL